MNQEFTTRSRRLHRTFATLIAFYFLVSAAQLAIAQTVSWGFHGTGGSGTWDTTNFNWYNGATSVHWPSNGNANFAGTAGTVTVPTLFNNVQVSSITFNTPGYVIQNGWLNAGPSGLTITANADATINSSLSGTLEGSVLVKNGPASLSFSSSFLHELRIDQGEVRATSFGAIALSDVVLADEPGVTLSLAPTGSSIGVQSLNGGGTAGGVVQPAGPTGTVEFSTNGGEFAGILQDKGGGVLAFRINNGTQTLTNANTYSGSTTVFAQLALAGNGSATSSPMTVFGTLALDNSATALSDRISDSLPTTINDGLLRVLGNDSASVNESAGPLVIANSAAIEAVQPGSAPTQVSFTSLERQNYATLRVDGPGVTIGGLVNGPSGIVSPFVTYGDDWAIVNSDNHLAKFTDYASDFNLGVQDAHVKLTGGATELSSAATRPTINLANSSTSVSQSLDLYGHSLHLTASAILSSGIGSNVIRSGQLSAANDLFINTGNQLTIESTIVDGDAPSMLVKAGPGTLTLSGANTYSGSTVVAAGTVQVTSDANLGVAPAIQLAGGTLQAAASFESSKGFLLGFGNIDTAGFDLTFSGTVRGGVNKFGPGTLALTAASTGTVNVFEGVLELTEPNSGSVVLRGGSLTADGQISRLSWNVFGGQSILDVGGPAAAMLTIGRINSGNEGTLQIEFGIGSAAQDFLAISDSFTFNSQAPGVFQFSFHNLGGVTTGVDYPLMSYRDTFSTFAGLFAFAPGMAEAGWAGTFTGTPSGLSVRFSSVPVPEPRLTALLLLQGAALVVAARRLSRKSRSSR